MRTQRTTTDCRSCGASIAFVRTRAGKQMPVDAESLTDEDVEILGRVEGVVDYRHGDHVSHFSTCPTAAQHRRRR